VEESKIVTSFYLVPEDNSGLATFRPGQYLSFRLRTQGTSNWIFRNYSLSDRPGLNYYRVTIKRETKPLASPGAPAGLSSNFFHDSVAVGSVLDVGSPVGHFYLEDNAHDSSLEPLVLLSAGIGFTPLISILNTLVHLKSKREIYYIHGTSSGDSHAMRDHLAKIAAENENVKLHVCYSSPKETDILGKDYHIHGFISLPVLKKVLPHCRLEVYCCGPPPFMHTMQRGFVSFGTPEEKFKYEYFGPERKAVKNSFTQSSIVFRP